MPKTTHCALSAPPTGGRRPVACPGLGRNGRPARGPAPSGRRPGGRLAGLGIGLGLGWFLSAGAAQAAGVHVLVQDEAGQALAGAVVFVSSPAATAALAAQKGPRLAEIAQEGRQFVPSVAVVALGTAVNFPNRDKVRHHIYSFSPAKRFEIKLYAGTPANPVVFDQPGIATLGCNIHDGMAAWVVVVDSAWYGQTQADGRVSLPAVTAGAHTLKVWHASLPPGGLPQELAVNVPANGAGQASLRLAGAQP